MFCQLKLKKKKVFEENDKNTGISDTDSLYETDSLNQVCVLIIF